MTILAPGQGQLLDLGGARGLMKTDAGDAFNVTEFSMSPDGFAPPPHRHRHLQEAMYVLEGRMDLMVGEERRVCEPGSFVNIRPGVVHGLAPVGGPARVLLIHNPGDLATKLMEAMASAFASGPPDQATMQQLLTEIDMEPVP
jgi:mannose-6-phosphate isomerase-like protein (cupin superfamily)